MQRLYKRRISICSLYDDDYSTLGIQIKVGPESASWIFKPVLILDSPDICYKEGV